MAMTTKLSRMIAHLDELLPIKSHDSLITWSCDITWQDKVITSPLPQCLWPWNLVGWWLILKGSKTGSLQHPDLGVLQSHVADEDHYFSTSRVPMASKLDRMVAHLDGLLPIKFHNPFKILWSCDITWRARTIIYSLSQWLWPRNLEEW